MVLVLIMMLMLVRENRRLKRAKFLQSDMKLKPHMREEKSARASIVLAIRYVAQPLPMGLIPPATWNIAGSGLISKANILLSGRRPKKATTQDILQHCVRHNAQAAAHCPP